MSTVRQLAGGIFRSAKLMIGFVAYLLSRQTPSFAYQSMIGLFCATGGRSNDLLSSAIGLFKGKYRLSKPSGFLGDMTSDSSRESVRSALSAKGYYVFEKRIPDEICDRLLEFATTHPCKIRPMHGSQDTSKVSAIYRRDAPVAVRYDFDTQDLLENPDVQTILADQSFVAVAQDYLNCGPVIDVLSMWWHTAFSDKPDEEAAQYYHFDMDRPKWLKFFIYLTDVGADNGPHTFITGSHITGGIPRSMLKKGYARLTDDEVESHYGKDAVVEFTAPRGTIIAEDTRGLHKGKHVVEGDRLILQIQFSNSLFGGYYPKAKMPDQIGSDLKDSVAHFPGLYSTYR